MLNFQLSQRSQLSKKTLIAIGLGTLASALVGCTTPARDGAAPAENVLRPAHDKTDLILVQGADAAQIVEVMRNYLKPRLYKEVPGKAVNPNLCQYVYWDGEPPDQAAHPGACTPPLKPVCFRLLENIRKSILSAQMTEMETHICAGRSQVKDGLLLEIVYGEEMKWSGSAVSVNAQKEFRELKDLIAERVGDAKVRFVRVTTATGR